MAEFWREKRGWVAPALVGGKFGHEATAHGVGLQHVSVKRVTRHTSHVTRHTSHVTRHTSHVPVERAVISAAVLADRQYDPVRRFEYAPGDATTKQGHCTHVITHLVDGQNTGQQELALRGGGEVGECGSALCSLTCVRDVL